MRMSEALRRTGSAARATTGAVRSGTRRTGGFVHRVTGASGAGLTGLSTLIELTAAGGAADAFVTVALAGTIFFSTSVDQARGRVVLFLLVTMAPFAILAPFIGPALDRMQQGRRYVLAGTLLARGLLCFGMSAAINSPASLLPAAFGVLVLQKAYGVARASITPRLLPEQITLVAANARSQLFTLIAAMLAGALAAGIQVTAGAAWVLRAGMIIYLAAMVLAFRLPDQVDVLPAPAAPPAGADARPAAPQTIPNGRPPAAADPRTVPSPDFYPNVRRRYRPAPETEPWAAGSGGPDDPVDYEPAALPPGAAPPTARASGRRWRTLSSLGPIVAEAMRGNAVLRAFSGYMVFFLAFLLRTGHFGVSHNVALGALVAAAAAGGIVAMAIGSLVRSRAPQLILFTMLTLAPIVTAVCAWFFSLEAAIAVAFTAALAAGLAKLALDSTVQHEIREAIRSSAFAVSETLNQVANVAGALAGVLVSILDNGQIGLAIAAAGLTAALVALIGQRRRRILAQPSEARARGARGGGKPPRERGGRRGGRPPGD